MRTRILAGGIALAVLAIDATAEQLIVTLEPLPGTVITGGVTVVVEAFLRNDGPDFLIRGYQVDLPCSLPGEPGSSGTIMTIDTTPLSIGYFSAAASGSIPWTFAYVPPNTSPPPNCGGAGCGCELGGRVIAQSSCRVSGSPCPGEPPLILPGAGSPYGNVRYMGTWRYTISECASGTFNIPYEVLTVPCQNTNLTRIVNEAHQCEPTNFIPGSITIPGGKCCLDDSCIAEGINQMCCLAAGGNYWGEGQSCSAPCPECVTDVDCDDGQFCNGSEACDPNTLHCVAGVPPDCPGSTACREGVCDLSGNGETGACTIANRPDGTPCPDDDACTFLEECFGGQCIFAPVDCPEDDEFCNGYEICDLAAGCVNVPACAPGETCDEVTDSCRHAAIPTASTWGLVVLGLALAALAKARFWGQKDSSHE